MEENVEEQKLDYKKYWTDSGRTWKWWILSLNIVGNVVLAKEILDVKKLKGAALAQWQIGVGFTYMAWVMWPSVLVIVCLGLFIRFELSAEQLKRQWIYLLLAISSIIIPLIVISNASTIIGSK